MERVNQIVHVEFSQAALEILNRFIVPKNKYSTACRTCRRVYKKRYFINSEGFCINRRRCLLEAAGLAHELEPSMEYHEIISFLWKYFYSDLDLAIATKVLEQLQSKEGNY
jgi:hypothetical protein